jgi:hypothetical protein
MIIKKEYDGQTCSVNCGENKHFTICEGKCLGKRKESEVSNIKMDLQETGLGMRNCF